jgi:hypothetical protein
MRIVKVGISLSILLVMTMQVFAGGGGSVYSRYGIGDLAYHYSARGLALGSVNLADMSMNYTSPHNPATWKKINLTRLELGLDYSSLMVNGSQGKGSYYNTTFSGITFSFPIERSMGIGAAMGLVPYSNVSYDIPETAANNQYSSSYNGSGGLTKLFVGASYTTPYSFSIGASLDYYLGKLSYKSQIDFAGSGTIRNGSYTTEHKYRGVGYTFGLLSSDLSKHIELGENISDVNVAFTFSYAGDLWVDTTFVTQNALQQADLNESTVKSYIPNRYGLGINMRYNKKYEFMLDYIYQPWSNYEFDGRSSEYLRDLQRVNLSVEYRNDDYRRMSFWEQIMLRGGLSYERSQYEIEGVGINTYSVHAGFSIPLGNQNTLNIGFKYGFRGETESNLVEENFFQTNISLSFGELWFVRQNKF